ncbi:MAG: hypothetical protein UR53_C0001G0061 [Candidatus Magasanikbacteria bacterium GW2011_GWC2_34_16]|uniref:Uncharacterized protein n=2 Tax=Candidatus Magasanikiibacteriota TaxID=1752731 RepID=A0A0G0JWA8_9BACT|nr:MAG: hypothetical protein UR53_C0001G0061 [Candidatus Magasanikbacteria bacterium GW2011_GWC2_34_16]KKQ41129.1 MAG: hypothetical protein US58_C0005G0054 [Candidatus Magasanikbacteria bacterium GW2011_GWA2_37_8]
MSIPLYIFLFIYFAFLIIFVFFSVVNIIHIIRTGSLTFASFIITTIIGAMTIFTLFFTWALLTGTNWQTPVNILNINNANDVINFNV